MATVSIPDIQKVSTQWKQAGSSSRMNWLLEGVLKPGLYQPITLSRESNSTVSVSKTQNDETGWYALLPLISGGGLVKVFINSDSDILDVDSGEDHQYVVLSFPVSSITSPSGKAQIEVKIAPSSSDIILGKCVFTGGVLDLTTPFDYSEQQLSPLASVYHNQDNFKVMASTTPPFTELHVSPGSITIDGISKEFNAPQDFLATPLPPTSQTRYEYIVVNRTGTNITIARRVGTNAVSPVRPDLLAGDYPIALVTVTKDGVFNHNIERFYVERNIITTKSVSDAVATHEHPENLLHNASFNINNIVGFTETTRTVTSGNLITNRWRVDNWQNGTGGSIGSITRRVGEQFAAISGSHNSIRITKTANDVAGTGTTVYQMGIYQRLDEVKQVWVKPLSLSITAIHLTTTGTPTLIASISGFTSGGSQLFAQELTHHTMSPDWSTYNWTVSSTIMSNAALLGCDYIQIGFTCRTLTPRVINDAVLFMRPQMIIGTRTDLIARERTYAEDFNICQRYYYVYGKYTNNETINDTLVFRDAAPISSTQAIKTISFSPELHKIPTSWGLHTGENDAVIGILNAAGSEIYKSNAQILVNGSYSTYATPGCLGIEPMGIGEDYCYLYFDAEP